MVAASSRNSAVYTDGDFIGDVYVALLGRDPDEVGRNTYLGGLSNGQFSRQDVLHQVLASEEYSNRYRSTSAGLDEPLGCTREEAMAVFGQFARYSGPGHPGYVTNFMGGVSDIAVSHLLDGASGLVEDYPIPGNFHGETLEWIGTLRAALESGHTFTMIELGAGWGPWCVIGAMAAKQKGISNVRVIGIEADAGHVDFMRRNFAANALAPGEAEVLHGAIGVENGTAYFPQARSADQVYGGAAAFSDDDKGSGPFAAFMRSNSGLVETVEAVPCLALSDQLNKFDVVDLVHCDIQGSELDLIPQSVALLTAKVKRLIVGTHSFEIDRRLSEVMGACGWVCEGVSACKMQGSPGGPRLVADGMQVWRNPKQTEAGTKSWTNKQVVTALYRTLLGREPDSAGLESHAENVSNHGIEYLTTDFLNSPEFKTKTDHKPGFIELGFHGPMSVQTTYTRDELESLWQHIAEVWSGLGCTDAFWSVLTDDRFRASNSPDEAAIRDFYESGRTDLHYLNAVLSRNGFKASDFETLAEYGCGVGRTTRWLAPEFRRVRAFDISEHHLSAARIHLSSVNLNNVEFIHVCGPDDLEKLQCVDLFFSVIVLQHNPPPIILDVLQRAFEGLNKGGVAVFQVPTHGADYSFNLHDYWRGIAAKKEMEIHFVPQRAVLDIAEGCGLRAIEVRPDHCLGHFHEWMSSTFVLQKR